jgi:hypothetical protein
MLPPNPLEFIKIPFAINEPKAMMKKMTPQTTLSSNLLYKKRNIGKVMLNYT